MILPAFNEAENIAPCVGMAVDTCTRLGLDFEVIVVDDGSLDGTPGAVQSLVERHHRVRVLRHPRNLGYGAALRTGIGAARGDLIFFTDADLQFEMWEVAQLLLWADSCDIIIGYRVWRADPLGRRLNAWIWGRLVGLLFQVRARDVDCAFKLFHRHVFHRISVEALGAFVNTEILVRAQAEGFRIHQVPVSHFPRKAGVPTGNQLRVVARAILELGRLHGSLRGTKSKREPGKPAPSIG